MATGFERKLAWISLLPHPQQSYFFYWKYESQTVFSSSRAVLQTLKAAHLNGWLRWTLFSLPISCSPSSPLINANYQTGVLNSLWAIQHYTAGPLSTTTSGLFTAWLCFTFLCYCGVGRCSAAAGGVFKFSALELLDLCCNFTPNSFTRIKSLGLLHCPRYMHRGSRWKFMTDNAVPCSSDSGAASLSMLTDRRSITPAQHHLNQPQVCTLSYLRPLACVNGAVSSTSPASASVNNTAAFMLLNPRSLNNIGLLINDIITDRKIDFLFLCWWPTIKLRSPGVLTPLPLLKPRLSHLPILPPGSPLNSAP